MNRMYHSLIPGNCDEEQSHPHQHQSHEQKSKAEDCVMHGIPSAIISSSSVNALAKQDHHHHQVPVLKEFYSARVGSTIFKVNSRHQNLKFLGQGSYGTVCSAYDRDADMVVAIKKISNVFRVLADAKRSLREVRLLQHLGQHENIVSLVDFYVIPNARRDFADIYLVMEKWPCDLDRIITSRQELTNEHIKLFLFQIIKGMQYMHSAGVVHRDMKPQNILVDSDCHLAICDFGLARGLNLPNMQHGFSHNDDLNGALTEYVVTRWYRSPELLVENTQFPYEADVWSIGCILGELLLRKPMMPGKSHVHQLEMIFELIGTPNRDELKAFCSKNSLRVIHQMSKKPGRRLENEFRSADPRLIDLLKKIFTFNPLERITIDEIFFHPYLKSLRDLEIEQDESCCSFDSSYEADYEKITMPKEVLQKLFWQDHLKFHPEDAKLRASKSLQTFSRIENNNPNIPVFF